MRRPRTPTCSSSRSASLWGSALQREGIERQPPMRASQPFQAGRFILDRNGDVWEFHEINFGDKHFSDSWFCSILYYTVLNKQKWVSWNLESSRDRAFLFGFGRMSATKRPVKNGIIYIYNVYIYIYIYIYYIILLLYMYDIRILSIVYCKTKNQKMLVPKNPRVSRLPPHDFSGRRCTVP